VIVANVEVKLRRDERLDHRDIVVAPTVLLRNPTRYSRYGKRALDVVIAATSLLLLSPVFVTLAVLVRLNLGPGGIIYRQHRVGRDGVPFQIYKFRSMLPDRRCRQQPYVGRERRQVHKSDCDPRHTRFGRFIRARSLDELPQLVNVLRGDMSLVGPRPELVTVASEEGFLKHPRHRERPGITGSFQVSPLRARNRIAVGLHLDIAYVADVRFRKDLVILARTAGVLVRRSS
jgi:lipopolysaccharide/colanic/teichoic acid biosynthesis glycosyltransferase